VAIILSYCSKCADVIADGTNFQKPIAVRWILPLTGR
jgi:hypothetical protein